MPIRKPVAKESLVKIATDAIAGVSKRDLMAKYPGVSERVIRLLMQNDVGAEEWRAAMMKEIQTTAGEALLELRTAIRERRFSPNSLPVAWGILMDKSAGFEARAAVGTLNVAVLVNGYGDSRSPSKEKLIAALEGREPSAGFLPKSGDSRNQSSQ